MLLNIDADDQQQRFLTTSEFAVEIGTNAPTIRRWIHTGVIRAVQPGGAPGPHRIPRSELARLEREAAALR